MKEKNKHRMIVLLARSNLNNIKIISKVLIDSDISHDEFTLVINEKQSFFRLKENIRAKDDQLSDIEGERIIAHGKRTGENESLKLKV